MTSDQQSPAYRAAIDRSSAAAIDAVTRQARALDDLDPAEAVHRLALALDRSGTPRVGLAGVLAALAVHVVRSGDRPDAVDVNEVMRMVEEYGVLRGTAAKLATMPGLEEAAGRRDLEASLLCRKIRAAVAR